jgi:hypothetical protein
MAPLRRHQARLLAQSLLWLAAAIGVGVAFGDSLGRSALWVVVAVAAGLVVRGRHAIAGWVRHHRPRRGS